MNVPRQFYDSFYDFLVGKNQDRAIFEVSGADCAVGTSRGPVREENQDRAIIVRSSFKFPPTSDFLVFAVSDGIGGMIEGATCARVALSSFISSLVFAEGKTPEEKLRNAYFSANSVVVEKFQGKGGATLTTLLVSKNDQSVVIGNVGDSRVYSLEKEGRGKAVQLTVDDTIEAQVAKIGYLNGDIAPELKGRLAQFMGMPEGLEPTISRCDNETKFKGFALTTDGVHSMSAETLTEILPGPEKERIVVSRLLDLAEWRGGHDNASVIVISPSTIAKFFRTQKARSSVVTAWSPFSQLEVAILEQSGDEASDTTKITPHDEIKKKTDKPEKLKGGKKTKNKRYSKKPRKKKKEPNKLDEDDDQISIEFIDE